MKTTWKKLEPFLITSVIAASISFGLGMKLGYSNAWDNHKPVVENELSRRLLCLQITKDVQDAVLSPDQHPQAWKRIQELCRKTLPDVAHMLSK